MLQNNTTKLYLRNITQAYVQSTSDLNQDFFICLPPELITMIEASSNRILKVVKSLYDVPEAGKNWFAIYHNYHINNFSMTESTYNLSLLYRYEPFSIVGLQTDDTLMLANNNFTAIEEEAIKTAKFMTKKQAYLLPKTPIKFNGIWIQLALNGNITLSQETCVRSISLIKNYKAFITSSRGVVRTNLL